jgi:hypothetical protein
LEENGRGTAVAVAAPVVALMAVGRAFCVFVTTAKKNA